MDEVELVSREEEEMLARKMEEMEAQDLVWLSKHGASMTVHSEHWTGRNISERVIQKSSLRD
jgi:hypothetical protein